VVGALQHTELDRIAKREHGPMQSADGLNVNKNISVSGDNFCGVRTRAEIFEQGPHALSSPSGKVEESEEPAQPLWATNFWWDEADKRCRGRIAGPCGQGVCAKGKVPEPRQVVGGRWRIVAQKGQQADQAAVFHKALWCGREPHGQAEGDGAGEGSR
jgi:hypothetical protein